MASRSYLGKALFDVIVRRGYRDALQLGASNGSPGIWIAWAVARTGGRLITVEPSSALYYRALKSFQNAGLTKRVDPRLGDPEEVLTQLVGPFDFVFFDSEVDWGARCLPTVVARTRTGGCVATFESSSNGSRNSDGVMASLRSFPELQIEWLDYSGRSEIAVAFKNGKLSPVEHP